MEILRLAAAAGEAVEVFEGRGLLVDWVAVAWPMRGEMART
jgi:hypothetical protein